MIYQFLALLAVHWVADFVCQTHWQASNKSKRTDALSYHVATYTMVLLMASLAIFGRSWMVIGFVMLNGVLHLATDGVTSRISSKLYAKQDWHNFFVVIGFDQLIHQVTLAGTMLLFFTA
jgi:uncharacterized protein DUF3307